jgi:hypothetical protein
MRDTEVITDREYLKQISPYAIRFVISYYEDGSAWTRYIILNRRKILYDLKKRNTRRGKEEIVVNYKPSWYNYYRGPGLGFAGEPFLLKKNRRFITICQSGGLDI